MTETPLNFVNLGTFALSASSGSALQVDVYLPTAVITKTFNLLVSLGPSATLGCQLNLLSGFGPADPAAVVLNGLPVVVGGSSVPLYAQNTTNYNHTATPTTVPAVVTGVQTFSIDVLDTLNAANGPGQGTWLKIKISNLDLTPGTVTLEATYR